MPAAREDQRHRRRLAPAIGLILVLGTAALYSGLRHHDFVNWDDPIYVTENAHVRAGLTWQGLRWALGATEAANWHPLTWLSHMADVELFGMDPGPHHLVNLLFHLLNTVLVFHVFRRLTGAVWRCAFVAALFAVHPLHVESVAWVSERKDVLSTSFWLLTMWAYVRYAELPSPGRYLAVFVSLGLGLTTKPMLVTLPFVLLLLDYWPLGRTGLPAGGTGFERRVLWEKLPLLALSAVSSAVTYVVQQKGGAVASLEALSIGTRLSNVPVSYVAYLAKTVWPYPLAIPYPRPGTPPTWDVGGSLLVLAFISLLARRRPYLTVGWLWYLGTLVPVIGLVQVGQQAMADRYTYVPLLGIFLAIAWGVPDIVARWPLRRAALAAASATALVALTVTTARQIPTWSNSRSLFGHAVRVTRDNAVARTYLGVALKRAGDIRGAIAQLEAVRDMNAPLPDAAYTLGQIYDDQRAVDRAAGYYRAALNIDPGHVDAALNLGKLLYAQGQREAALTLYRRTLERRPDDPRLLNNLGGLLTEIGMPDEGREQLERALRLDPDYPEAHANLGTACLALGRREEAMEHYARAVELDPANVPARHNLGIALQQANRLEEAVAAFEGALLVAPDSAPTQASLGDTWVKMGRLDAALEAYAKALRIDPQNADVYEKIGLVLLRQGRPSEAQRSFERALEIAPEKADLRRTIERLRKSQAP